MSALHNGNATSPPIDIPEDEHGLLARATEAAQRYRELAPDVFHRRYDEWPRWTRRAVTSRWIATALGVPVDAVMVTNDPDRHHGIAEQFSCD